MQKLSKKILAEIKKQKIAPRARLVFRAKNYGIWFFAILGILFIGIFLGNAIHEFAMEEWNLMHHFPGGRANFFFHAIPFLWLFGLAAAFAFVFFLFRKTKKGYKFSILAVSGVIFVASIICAISFLSSPLPSRFQEFRIQNFPPPFNPTEWQNPADGFLIGEIIELQNKILQLDAIDDSRWTIDFAESEIAPEFEIAVGKKIRAVGEKTGELEFAAELILPEKPPKVRGNFTERKMMLPAY